MPGTIFSLNDLSTETKKAHSLDKDYLAVNRTNIYCKK